MLSSPPACPISQGPTFVAAKVFLGGVSNDTNDDSLRAYCGQWGEIADVHVFSGKGYAFVTFAAVPTAQAFLEVRWIKRQLGKVTAFDLWVCNVAVGMLQPARTAPWQS